MWGAVDYIREAIERGWRISIFDKLSMTRKGRAEMKSFVASAMESRTLLSFESSKYRGIFNKIEWPTKLPDYHVFIAERTIRFQGVFPEIETLEKFRSRVPEIHEESIRNKIRHEQLMAEIRRKKDD